eukprot:TRINITY_DN5210_c0_g1_i1.p1 TRINITY_DN5210_c0_g1~~TRINITY_DN5210_c0_g1_i1.p1  ORF type:complete len:188 (-),score=56.39 TRINITY_DN5210_c0_g1_i1:257-820(-)
MGLLTIIRKIQQRERELRLLVLGLDSAGKTTCVKRFNGDDVNTISPTLGFNIITLFYKSYKLNFFDVGGQRSLRTYWRNYFEQTDGLIWVVDCTDRERMEDCRRELHALLLEEKLSGASLLILANKQDVHNALSPEEVSDVLGLADMEMSRHFEVVGCSAISGEGLARGIDWLVGDIAARMFLLCDE